MGTDSSSIDRAFPDQIIFSTSTYLKSEESARSFTELGTLLQANKYIDIDWEKVRVDCTYYGRDSQNDQRPYATPFL